MGVWGPPTTFLPLQPICHATQAGCQFSLLFRPPLCGSACSPSAKLAVRGQACSSHLGEKLCFLSSSLTFRHKGGYRSQLLGRDGVQGLQGPPQLSPLRLVSTCLRSLTPVPPGTLVAFFISGNRLRTLLVSVPWLLFQNPVLGCGEDTREDGPRPLQESTVHGLDGEGRGIKGGSDRTTRRRGRRRTPFFLFLTPVDRNCSLP